MKTILKSLLLFLTFHLLSFSAFSQGSLTPPGAPTPTMKTLDQVEARIPVDDVHTPGDGISVYIINQPGSYYLTGNITGVPFKRGITIAVAGVTLDLNGFTLSGVPNASAGIFCANGVTRIAVVNGTITGWPLDGIDGGLSINARFEKLVATLNGNGATRAGIRAGQAAVIRDCVASGNTGHGFRTGNACVFTSCNSYGNTASGFALSNNEAATNCVASLNGANGFEGGNGCTFTGCVATENTQAGFNLTDEGNLLDRCLARGNSGLGITGQDSLTVTNSTVVRNGLGGITAANGATIHGCTVLKNLGNVGTVAGISVLDGASVRECTVRDNSGNGIRCGIACQIVGNTCHTNAVTVSGTAGIRVIGHHNRIESNTATSNGSYGFRVDGTDNTIIKNSARGNQLDNYFIPGSNDVGPFSTAATATSAWANMSY
jgi:parallel beta-helix repeat protein